VFATIDNTGNLSLWDLNCDTEVGRTWFCVAFLFFFSFSRSLHSMLTRRALVLWVYFLLLPYSCFLHCVCLQEPLYTETLSNPILNRLAWQLNSHHLSVGDSTGHVHVYDTSDVGLFQLYIEHVCCVCCIYIYIYIYIYICMCVVCLFMYVYVCVHVCMNALANSCTLHSCTHSLILGTSHLELLNLAGCREASGCARSPMLTQTHKHHTPK
jgi:hypothetical protein